MSGAGEERIRVTIDANALAFPLRTGIGRYLESVLPRLIDLAGDGAEFILLAGKPICDPMALELIKAGKIEERTANLPSLYLFQQTVMGRWVNQANADVHFAPDGLLPLGIQCQSVGVVHDMIWKRYPETASFHIRAVFAMRQAASLKKLSVALADSEATKRDLIADCGKTAERVDVVPLGVDTKQFHQRRAQDEEAIFNFQRKHEMVGSFYLSIGNLMAHKNLALIPKAFEVLQRRGSIAPRLAIIGHGNTKELLARAGASIDARQIQCLGYMPELEIPIAYRAARALIFPSLYEGFGLPVLEAMASGIPVICSNRASLPEVAGEAALLFDPASAESLADAITRLETEAGLYDRLVRAGLDRAGLFTWEACAARVWSAIKRAAEMGKRASGR